jgi:hypothetical protein
MGCDSSYLEPHDFEVQTQRAAKLLLYVLGKTGGHPETWLAQEAVNIYANDKRIVPQLCAALQALSPQQIESIVYDAHSVISRDLADWWEAHQRADAERAAREKGKRVEEELRKQALAKLSLAEQMALGINKP